MDLRFDDMRGIPSRVGTLKIIELGCTSDPRKGRTCPLPDHALDSLVDRDMMHLALAAMSSGHMTYLATTVGRTRSSAGLGGLISSSAAEAGFKKSAHGLRATRAIALAENGATAHQIGAWTGHKSIKEIEHYTAAANRRRAVMGTAKHVPPE
jgi:integrase